MAFYSLHFLNDRVGDDTLPTQLHEFGVDERFKGAYCRQKIFNSSMFTD